jgi:hypothetical protein
MLRPSGNGRGVGSFGKVRSTHELSSASHRSSRGSLRSTTIPVEHMCCRFSMRWVAAARRSAPQATSSFCCPRRAQLKRDVNVAGLFHRLRDPAGYPFPRARTVAQLALPRNTTSYQEYNQCTLLAAMHESAHGTLRLTSDGRFRITSTADRC